MIIKEIELNNFRIYKGKNKIELSPDADKNIVIVSGDNGFGKTTFLMSLVWCLYGRQMDKVDDLYKKEIDEKGGYSKYIGNSLNLEAQREGETGFSVAVTFTDVEIPNTTCTEIKIIRSYDSSTNTDDQLQILIDGRISDLFSDTKEEELFIRDYILPIEIAKFFFFDAEKIVSFAQINTPDQRAELSKAYSQVLGIHKYDELKKELEKLQDEYRKEAAQPKEKEEFNKLLASIATDEGKIEDIDREVTECQEKLTIQKYNFGELQERLIREGDLMSVEKLHELEKQRERLEIDVQQAQEGLKDLYNYIPFGLAGNVVASVSDQLNEERAFKQTKLQLEGIEEKTDEILNDLDKARNLYNGHIDVKIRNFYEDQIRKLISKYFFNNINANKYDGFQVLHDFTEIQYDDFQSLLGKIKESKSTFEILNTKYAKAKAEQFAIEKQIRDAEKKAESDYIKGLRNKKDELEQDINHIQEEIARLNILKDQKKDDIKANKQKKEILSRKIEVSARNKAVDDEATHLIHLLQMFLLRFKDEKKRALEKKLKEKLIDFLHKKSLVHSVAVDIQGNGEDVDINLMDANGRKIDKGILSMGERQMFASALLGALVDETEIDFPVFIDSPMQKFDVNHSKNILTKFYPNVSKQVVLFPLLMKELTEDEYKLIEKHVHRAYLIENNADGSHFKEIEPKDLFKQYKNK